MTERYPRMLFRDGPGGVEETTRAESRDELLAKRALGWRARLLPGETPEDIGETEAPSSDLASMSDVQVAEAIAASSLEADDHEPQQHEPDHAPRTKRASRKK